jgi:dihydroorotate dehydrogenase
MRAFGRVLRSCNSTARLVYEGPFLARTINKGLAALLKRDGFDNIAQAIGVDVD